MHPNAKLIETFYTAFQRKDAETMAACYAPDASFSDPVFTHLQGGEAGDMWRMLLGRSKDLALTFDGVIADDHVGRAHWVATYTFAQTGRKVVNDIHATFTFRDGKIVKHVDRFDLWKWTRQALGFKGTMLGWSPLVSKAVRKQAGKALEVFRSKKA